MRRLLGDRAAVTTWLAVTVVGILVALVADATVGALLGWVLGGVAASVVAAVRGRRVG